MSAREPLVESENTIVEEVRLNEVRGTREKKI